MLAFVVQLAGFDPVQLHYLPGYGYDDVLETLMGCHAVGIALGFAALFVPRTNRVWGYAGIIGNLFLLVLVSSLVYA
jgi:hypothetical protein